MSRLATMLVIMAVRVTTGGAQERPVVWSASVPAAPVARGGTVHVQLTARIDVGWHLYSLTQGPGGPIPTRIALVPDEAFALESTPGGPPPTKRFDANFGIPVEMYDAHTTFDVPVRVTSAAAIGVDTMTFATRYQACNATLCLPPLTQRLAVPVRVTASRASGARPASGVQPAHRASG